MAASVFSLAVAVLAFCASVDAKVNITQQDANFDDLTVLIPGESLTPVPTPYKGLAFNGFDYGPTPEAVDSVVPSSQPNLAFHSTATVGTANITTKYTGSKSFAFDLQSFAGACSAPTQNGDASPPVNCTLTLTGTKFPSGKTVSANFHFGTGTANGISLKSLPTAPFKVPSSFGALSSVVITANSNVVPNIGGATLEFEIDDVRYILAQTT